jgi:hypothetical protein
MIEISPLSDAFKSEAMSSKSSMKQQSFRLLVSEKQLLNTHSKEMYCYLRKNLRYEKKVHIKKELLLAPNFEEEINRID